MTKTQQQQGFTLIEILVVVVLVAIVTVTGVQMLNAGSVERNILNKAHNLKAAFSYACHQATFQNTIYGLHVMEEGYGFSRLSNSQWLSLETEQLPLVQWEGDFSLQLKLEGQSISLESELAEKPHVICHPSGEVSEFSLQIHHPANQVSYELKTVSLWEVEGEWMHED